VAGQLISLGYNPGFRHVFMVAKGMAARPVTTVGKKRMGCNVLATLKRWYLLVDKELVERSRVHYNLNG
jgi:hypothetical protein